MNTQWSYSQSVQAGTDDAIIVDCRYERGEWSDCDPDLRLKKRQDIIKDKYRNQACPSHRTITKPCEQKGLQKGITFTLIYII